MDTSKGTEDATEINPQMNSSKTHNPGSLSDTPCRHAVLHKESPHGQLVLFLDTLFNDLSELIDARFGPDTQILTPEDVLGIFLDTKCVNEKNDKDMELLIIKAIPQLQDPNDPAGGIPRASILYYFAAFFLITKIHNPEEIPPGLEPIVERYTLPKFLTLAQKTVQLKYNYIANSLGRKHTPDELDLIFKPQINENAGDLSSAYWRKLSVDSDDVYKRLTAWTEHRNKNHEETVQRKQSKDANDLTFIPTTNKRPAKREKSAKGQEKGTPQPPQSRREVEDAAATRLYEQGIARHIKIQKLHSENLRNNIKREMEQCTFSPQIRELKHSIISGAGLVSSTDSHRRSIVSAIARMRQSNGSEAAGSTPEPRYTSQTRREYHPVDQGLKKLSRSLMKTLDLMISPSPPCSGSYSLRSVTPNAYDSSIHRRAHTKSEKPDATQDLSAAAVITAEKYCYKTLTSTPSQGTYRRSLSGLTRSSFQDYSHSHTPRADALSRSYTRSPSRSLSPTRMVKESKKQQKSANQYPFP